jgi:NTE family protein
LKIPIDLITGASIGAFIAGLYAFGLGWQELEDVAGELEWLEISGFAPTQYGLMSNHKLGVKIRELIGDIGFGRARIPLGLIASDIITGEKVPLTTGNVAEAIMASSCIPGIFTPIEIDGRMLVDGGLLENVPTLLARDMGAELIIAVDLFSTIQSHRKPENLFELLLNTYYSAMRNASEPYLQAAHILIAPATSTFNLVTTNQIPALIQEGYLAAMDAMLLREDLQVGK